jgi:hypothetical protein
MMQLTAAAAAAAAAAAELMLEIRGNMGQCKT